MLRVGAGRRSASNRGGGGFNVAQLFARGEQGTWFDPSDFTTLFQDAAGTTPVTAVGQPVGKMLDKSGRGNHATQATAGNRPLLQQDASGRYYLALNGTTACMATAAINLSGTNKVTVLTGYRVTAVSFGCKYEFSDAYDAHPGTFTEFMQDTGGTFTTASAGAGANQTQYGLTASVNTNYVSSCTFDLTNGNTCAQAMSPRMNGAAASVAVNNNGPLNGGNFGNYPLYIGARAGNAYFATGRLYGLIVRGATSSAAEIKATEAYLNQRVGAY